MWMVEGVVPNIGAETTGICLFESNPHSIDDNLDFKSWLFFAIICWIA